MLPVIQGGPIVGKKYTCKEKKITVYLLLAHPVCSEYVEIARLGE
jgi:hypothetical protein